MIVFCVGMLTGVLAGWAILYILVALYTRPKEPPTKDEWKEWF